MAQKTINEQPKVTDTIVLEIQTPDADGCFVSNPYKVDSLIVYYVQRSYSSRQFGEYDKTIIKDSTLRALQNAQAAYCDNPSDENLQALELAKSEVSGAATVDTSFYSGADPVLVLGSPQYPAWLSTDTDNALTNVSTDSEGNPIYGRFEYLWSPNGSIRPGDYFMCWTWTPNPAGGSFSETISFTIEGDPQALVSIPVHACPEEKYPVLLERYLPEVYKGYLSQNDITPETLQKLQSAVAVGFRDVENLANQLIDLYDANAVHESLLVYLANMFNLKLKSSDPTLWRRQIKEAVPLFKQKGTRKGLNQAFSQAGMFLNRVTNLWQITSNYTNQESFRVGDSLTWRLAKNVVLPIDPTNFQIAVRSQNSTSYVVRPNNSVSFTPSECSLYTDMSWVGANPPSNGDIVRVLYAFKSVPPSQQTNENYIRSLPLADLRDEADQLYPLKNWNVHVIEESDPMFGVLVPVRHPFHDPLVFGRVRTEFPYSENIYNMEEYNGSTRDSFNPCDIDKDFVDPCGSCMSSKFSVDIGVQELSDDRIHEIHDILRENVPFHAFVHSVNLTGEVSEFVPPPVETLEALVDMRFEEYVLSGNANPFFHRVMEEGVESMRINRDQMSHVDIEATGTGTAYNDYIAFVAPLHNLERAGVRTANHALEVLAPSPNAGVYTIEPVDESVAKVTSSVAEPLNKSMFTYRLSNINYSTSIADVEQVDLDVLTDPNVDFVALGVQGEWDVANVPGYAGGIWKVVIGIETYNVYTVLPDGGLVLSELSPTLPTSSTGVTYTLLRPNNSVATTSSTGYLTVTSRGSVDLNDPGITDLTQFVKVHDYVHYSGVDYHVCGLEGGRIIMDNYAGGNAGGVTLSIRRRLIEKGIGYFDYAGLKLTTPVDHESGLGIQNGANPPVGDLTDNSLWKENFLVKIGDNYYKVAHIDGTDIVLDGLPHDWKTIGAGGTSVNYEIHHFIEDTVEAGFVVFDQLDREGKDPVIREILSTVTNDVAVVALQMPSGNDIQDVIRTEEGVSFEIEWKDGKKTQGEIL